MSFGSESYTTSPENNNNQSFTGWSQQTTTFTASSATQDLVFAFSGTPEGVAPIGLLDGVILTEVTTAVPEPGTLMMAGLLSLGGGVVSYRKLRRKSEPVA